jgi:hypothetical protein
MKKHPSSPLSSANYHYFTRGVKLNKPLHKIHQNFKNHIYNIAIMEGEITKCTCIQST